MAETPTSRNVNAKEALECIRGPMSNAEVMEKFKISAQGYADLLKQLYLKKLITDEDMGRRGIRFKVVKPASPAEKQPEREPEPVVPPVEDHHGEEFLDTVELTELLSFKAASAATPGKDEPSEIPPPEPDVPDPLDKKGRFSISGLFKKGK